MKCARPGALFGPKVVILVAIWMPKGQVLTTFESKSYDLGGHLDLYTHGLDLCWIKKLCFSRFGWSFGPIYVRPGGLFGQKVLIWVIWMVIWTYIRTAWGPFGSKSCDLGHLDGHLDLYTYGLGLFLVKK